jgi:hypothetical protein
MDRIGASTGEIDVPAHLHGGPPFLSFSLSLHSSFTFFEAATEIEFRDRQKDKRAIDEINSFKRRDETHSVS